MQCKESVTTAIEPTAVAAAEQSVNTATHVSSSLVVDGQCSGEDTNESAGSKAAHSTRMLHLSADNCSVCAPTKPDRRRRAHAEMVQDTMETALPNTVLDSVQRLASSMWHWVRPLQIVSPVERMVGCVQVV